MAVIKLQGYEVSSDPGIQNFTSYRGQIDVKDITPDMDESEIIVGEQLPKWPGYDKPIVKEFVPGEHLALRYHDEDVMILKGEEVQLDSSLFSQEYGVCCYILECVKMI